MSPTPHSTTGQSNTADERTVSRVSKRPHRPNAMLQTLQPWAQLLRLQVVQFLKWKPLLGKSKQLRRPSAMLIIPSLRSSKLCLRSITSWTRLLQYDIMLCCNIDVHRLIQCSGSPLCQSSMVRSQFCFQGLPIAHLQIIKSDLYFSDDYRPDDS